MVRISVSELGSLVRDALRGHGYDEDEVATISKVLLYAQLRGNNQGVIKLVGPAFAKNMSAKPISIVRETSATALLDGGQRQGMILANRATDVVIQKARTNGVGLVGTSNSGSSTGAIGYYVGKIARKGLIGIMMAGSPPVVSPHGSKDRMFGTNPIAIGVPTEDDPLVLDMATSAIAWFGCVPRTPRRRVSSSILAARDGGVGGILGVMQSRLAGKPIPEGVALDKDGNVSTNAAEVLESGSLNPFDLSYKGSHLAMMVEVLTGPLVRASFGGIGAVNNWGMFYIAIDPNFLAGNLSLFKREVSQLIDKVRHSSPVPGGSTPIAVASERGNAVAAEHLKRGTIDVEESLLRGLRESAAKAPSRSKM